MGLTDFIITQRLEHLIHPEFNKWTLGKMETTISITPMRPGENAHYLLLPGWIQKLRASIFTGTINFKKLC